MGAGGALKARVVQRMPALGSRVAAVAWSRRGEYLAVAGTCGAVAVHAVLGGRGGAVSATPVRVLSGHAGPVLAMAWSASGFLATAGADRAVRLWHPATDACLRALPHPDVVAAVAFHPADDALLATGAADGVARLWRPADHRVAAETPPGPAVSAAAFAPDGDALLVGRYDGSLAEHDLRDALSAAPPPPPHDAPPARLEPSAARHTAPARRRARGCAKVAAVAQGAGELVAVTADGRAHVWAGGAEPTTLRLRGATRWRAGGGVSQSLTPDARFLVGAADGGDVHVLDFAVCRAAGGVRGLVRGGALPLETLSVLRGAAVSAAEFAPAQAVDFITGVQCAKGSAVLAVGGDDGVVAIVSNADCAQVDE